MTDKQKIKEYFEEYLNKKGDRFHSKGLIDYMHNKLHQFPIETEIVDIISFLVDRLDEVKSEYKKLVENNCTPPPIIIAPETEEGKALLKSIIEMQNKTNESSEKKL